MKPIKIMFVCHGNICRSPLAEFVLKHMVKQRGIEDQFIINSSGTSSEEENNPIYRRIVDTLNKYEIPFEDHRAVQLQKSDYPNYDYFIGMDKVAGDSRLTKSIWLFYVPGQLLILTGLPM